MNKQRLWRRFKDTALLLITVTPVIAITVWLSYSYLGYRSTPFVLLTLLILGSFTIGFGYLSILNTMFVEVIRVLRLHGTIGNLHVLFMQAATDHGTVLVERIGNHYELCPITRTTTNDGKEHDFECITQDDYHIPVDGELNELYQLKGKAFGMTVEIDPGVFSDIKLPAEDQREEDEEIPEYEIKLDDRRSIHEILAYNPFPGVSNILVDAGKVHARLMGTNGVNLLRLGKEQALMDKGGEQHLGQGKIVLGIVVLALMGTLSGLLVVGAI